MTTRIFNIVMCLILGAILLIPGIIITLLVKLTSKGPALHWSKRIGKNNKPFLMPKFRSMKTNTPQLATHLLSDNQSYLTPIGPFLRKSSLDEIPQILAIIKGDMNFVGPRPALYNQDDLIEQRTLLNIHTLTPGITGWAQINGRDELSIPDKVKLDKEYLDKRSFIFDIKILARTVIQVLKRADVHH